MLLFSSLFFFSSLWRIAQCWISVLLAAHHVSVCWCVCVCVGISGQAGEVTWCCAWHSYSQEAPATCAYNTLTLQRKYKLHPSNFLAVAVVLLCVADVGGHVKWSLTSSFSFGWWLSLTFWSLCGLKVLFQSSKVVAVMVIGAVLFKKRYMPIEYVATLSAIVGLILFSKADNKSSSTSTLNLLSRFTKARFV